MRYLVGSLLSLLCALASSHAAEIEFGRYHALVIGINDYQHFRRLETAVNDASAVHDVLRREYGYQSTLLLNPTREDLLRAMEKLRAELTENDNLLLYYAGHGVLDRAANNGFWLPANADDDSQIEWVPLTTVTGLLRATAARQILVIADSCYSGTLTRDAPVMTRLGPAREAELRRISRIRTRKALTSGGLEPVFDGGGDGHSVFTRAFLKILQDNDQVLDGYQLFHDLRRQVIVNAAQTPEYGDIRFAGDEGGDFLFVPKRPSLAAPAPVAPPLNVDDRTLDHSFWEAAKDSTDPAAFEAYLAHFPNGIYAVLARLRLDELKAAAGPAPAQQRVALLVPPAPVVEVAEMDAVMVATGTVNVRALPTPKGEKLAQLSRGETVTVTGKVKDAAWYRIEREGGEAYIYAPLVQDRESWEEAKRQAEAAARRQAEDEARRKAEDEARRAEARARQEAEAAALREKAEREAALRRRQEADDARRREREAEAQRQREAAEKARAEAAEKERLAAAEKARAEAAEKERLAAAEREKAAAAEREKAAAAERQQLAAVTVAPPAPSVPHYKAPEFLSKAEIKALLTGKTIKFTSPKDNVTTWLYFERNDILRGVQGSNVKDVWTKAWWVTDDGMLCRTYSMRNKSFCTRLTYDAAKKEIAFRSDYGSGVYFYGELLDGRRLGQ